MSQDNSELVKSVKDLTTAINFLSSLIQSNLNQTQQQAAQQPMTMPASTAQPKHRTIDELQSLCLSKVRETPSTREQIKHLMVEYKIRTILDLKDQAQIDTFYNKVEQL